MLADDQPVDTFLLMLGEGSFGRRPMMRDDNEIRVKKRMRFNLLIDLNISIGE